MGGTDSKPRSGLWAGACSAGVGLLLTSVVWSQPEMLRVPSPVAYLAAGTFVAAGASLILQALGYKRAQLLCAFLCVTALAGVGGWIAVGPGSRACTAGLDVLPLVAGELACRSVFGAGTLLAGLIAAIMLRPLLQGTRG